jgi:hypothetical protein
MNNETKLDYVAFLNAIEKLGIFDKKNHATLHHSAASTSDWNEMENILNANQDDTTIHGSTESILD